MHAYSENLFGWTGRTLRAFAIHNWQLTSIGNGTKVEVSECLTGLTIKLLKKKMKKELPRMMGKDLQDLKNKCEQSVLEERELQMEIIVHAVRLIIEAIIV